MKRQIVLLLVAVVFWTAVSLGFASGASAHELQQNKGISAVLHIAPDDNPVALEDTLLDFDFTSQKPGFDLRYCACKVSIQTSAERLLTTSIVSNNNSASVGHAVINFPEAGVYSVRITGFTSDKLTERFQLAFQVRVVVGQGDKTVVGWQIVMLSATSLVLFGVLAAEIIRRGGRYSR